MESILSGHRLGLPERTRQVFEAEQDTRLLVGGAFALEAEGNPIGDVTSRDLSTRRIRSHLTSVTGLPREVPQ